MTEDGYERIDVGAVPTGEWVHLAGTYDGETMRAYINGMIPVGGVQGQTGKIMSSTDPLVIGKRCTGDERYFRGRIDEVRIYDRALTASEIAALAQ